MGNQTQGHALSYKTIEPTTFGIHIHDGVVQSTSPQVPLIETVDKSKNSGLAVDKELHMDIGDGRVLVIYVTEHTFSELRGIAAVERLREEIAIKARPKKKKLREKSKRGQFRRPRRGGGGRRGEVVEPHTFSAEEIMRNVGRIGVPVPAVDEKEET